MLFQDNFFHLNLFQDPWKFLILRHLIWKVEHLTIRNDASHDAMLYRQQAENYGNDDDIQSFDLPNVEWSSTHLI